MENRWNVLWKAHLKGDEKATSDLYGPLFKLMVLSALRIVRDTETARDHAAEVWLKLISMDDPSEVKDVRSWCAVTIRNRCFTQIKLETRRAEILKEEKERWNRHNAHADEPLHFKELKEAVSNSLNALEEQIWDLHQAGFDNQEIASKLKMTPKTVANRKSMIRQKL